MTEFERFQRIRLIEINEMLSQCFERSEAIAILRVEKQAIEHYFKTQHTYTSVYDSPREANECTSR